MPEPKKTSIYTDLSKHLEFKSRLQSILDRPDSSISNYYLTRGVSDRFNIFLVSTNPRYDFTTVAFDFCNFFSRKTERDDAFYSEFLKDGFVKEDIDSLADLFNDFTFENFFEGLFFASKFFDLEDKIKSIKNIIFKFTPQHDNQCIVENAPMLKYYSVVTKELLKSLFYEENVSSDSRLVKLNTYSFDTYKKLNTCIDDLVKKQRNNLDINYLVVEHYKNFATFETYVKSVSNFSDNGSFVEVSIKDFLSL